MWQYLIILLCDQQTLNSITLMYHKRDMYVGLSICPNEKKKEKKKRGANNVTVQIFQRERKTNQFRFYVQIFAIFMRHVSFY